MLWCAMREKYEGKLIRWKLKGKVCKREVEGVGFIKRNDGLISYLLNSGISFMKSIIIDLSNNT